jgi:hypothetical protein
VRPDTRVLTVGAPGTGKSTLCRWLFSCIFGPKAGHRWRVLIDPQDVYELVPEHGTCEAHGPDAIDWRAEVIRVYPKAGTPEEWDRLYLELNKRSNVCVWLDEASMVAPVNRPSAAIRSYQTGGRKFTRAHLVAAQFPATIDRTLIDQADHRAVFQLDRREDRQRIASMMGLAVADFNYEMGTFARAEAGRRSHEFFWQDAAAGHTRHMRQLPPEAIAHADDLVRALR